MAKTPQVVPIGTVSREIGLSPSRIRELTAAGVFSALRTSGGHRRYDLDQTRAAWLRHRLTAVGLATTHSGSLDEFDQVSVPDLALVLDLSGLQEDQVWRDEVSPSLDLEEHPLAQKVSAYTFTEMLNNAVDHSGGSSAAVSVWRSSSSLVLEIADDGIGALRRLVDGKNLPHDYAAVSELTKGKQTTDPDRHTGEGIFFTSKAVDVFTLESNGIKWTVDNLREDYAVGVSATTTGTKIRLTIDPETSLDLGALFRQFTEDSHFVRTRPVVKLFGIGVSFVSRSEAKRLLVGMDQFSEVEIDFTGVESVGQGFVDEIFRVWPQGHPGTDVFPSNMNPAVEFMVRRAIPARDQ